VAALPLAIGEVRPWDARRPRWRRCPGERRKKELMRLAPVVVGPLLACVVASAAVSAASAQAPDPLAVARLWFAADQGPDVGAQLALMTDDAVLSGAAGLCSTPCVGKAAIRPELERRRTGGTTPQLTIVRQEATGNTVTTRLEIRAQPVRNAGFERYINVIRIEVRGDKVAVVRAAPDTSDPETAAYLAAVQRMQAAQRQVTQLPRTGGLAAALPVALGLGLAGLGLTVRGSRREASFRSTPRPM
jgi:hypothetical protein